MKILKIPEYWLVGMHQQGYTTAQAVTYWQEQERLESECRQNPLDSHEAGR